MEELIQLKNKLLNERPASWEEFPDIGLYKDQVVSYISKQLIHFDDEERLTSAMINNYIKDKLLPRTEGKKYAKEHLAGLIEICILKQILSVRDTGYLIKQETEGTSAADFYEKFKEIVDKALAETAQIVNEEWTLQDLSTVALQMAVSSYCNKLVCERLIDIMRSKSIEEQPGRSDKKQEKKADRKQMESSDDIAKEGKQL